MFYADIKTDIRFDNRFDIRLWNSIHVKHTIDFVTKLRFMVWFNMEAIPKSDIKSVIKFDIGIKPTNKTPTQFLPILTSFVKTSHKLGCS